MPENADIPDQTLFRYPERLLRIVWSSWVLCCVVGAAVYLYEPKASGDARFWGPYLVLGLGAVLLFWVLPWTRVFLSEIQLSDSGITIRYPFGRSDSMEFASMTAFKHRDFLQSRRVGLGTIYSVADSNGRKMKFVDSVRHFERIRDAIKSKTGLTPVWKDPWVLWRSGNR